jgi:hypothetical protein
MGGPFNSAWALLKNDPYPLTSDEEKILQMQIKAYKMARGANPQPHNMTDEHYEDAIELSAEAILAGMMAKKNPDYPWPKKQAFQTTFENDGSINRDPMVARQRKLNARMARESNRREGVPSRIEVSSPVNNRGGRHFSLVNDEGEVLSEIRGFGNNKVNSHIYDFYGTTAEPYRRQNMYRKLMEALIGAGIPIKSNERNYQSNPFHQKLLESLPPNIESSYVDEYGNPRGENSVEDLDYDKTLNYGSKKVPQFLDAQGERSGLNRQDYNAIPMVYQENQARSMDKFVEQDRAKIRRGEGHKPELAGIIAQQPMAWNTTQIQLPSNGQYQTPIFDHPYQFTDYDDEGFMNWYESGREEI